MKNNKKLVVIAGAAVLGLVAATGVTSTFAWFATNNTVSATSLSVTAKSNATYLLIDTAENAAASQKANSSNTSKNGVNPSTNTAYGAEALKVHPAAYTTIALNEANTSVAANNWYTATVQKKDVAVKSVNNDYTSMTQINLGAANYFVKYDFYLTLGTGSAPYTGGVEVKPTFTDASASLKAAVLFDVDKTEPDLTKFDIFAATAAPADTTAGRKEEFGATSGKTYTSVSLDDTSSIKVTVYLYVDGNAEKVNSDYLADKGITGSVDFKFTLANA